MFPAARLALRLRLALWVRLTLRLWRVLHTRHALSAAGIRGWTAALDPRFPVGAWRTGVNGTRSLRAALDPCFPVRARRTGGDGTLRLRAALNPGFPVDVRRTGVDSTLRLRAALDPSFPVDAWRAGIDATLRLRATLDTGFPVGAWRTGVDGDVLHIRIANVGGIDVVARSVVVKTAAVPVATDVADAEVAEPIIDPAVEAYARTPITRIPGVVASIPAPVSWRP